MLNCTDLACVLHHHHFYAHLHHLRHHLQDDNESSSLGDGSDVDDNDNTKGVSNETDSDLSSLSHVDAPNDVIYMVCGVVIAMLLVGIIIILVAVTINKLRKREETASASPANIEAQTTNFGLRSRTCSSIDSNCSSSSSHSQQSHQTHQRQQNQSSYVSMTSENRVVSNNAANLVHCNNNNNNNNHNNNKDNHQQEVSFIRTSGGVGVGVGGGNNGGVVTNGWVFPPKAPTPNIYNCSNNLDALIAANEKNGFKGFRKQFSGRFKRLVAKKPQEPTPVIPPELKPQLKTIYVY